MLYVYENKSRAIFSLATHIMKIKKDFSFIHFAKRITPSFAAGANSLSDKRIDHSG